MGVQLWVSAELVKEAHADDGMRSGSTQATKISLDDLRTLLAADDSSTSVLKSQELVGMDGIKMNFIIPVHSGMIMVFVNGILQRVTDNGTSITFTVAPLADDAVTVTYL